MLRCCRHSGGSHLSCRRSCHCPRASRSPSRTSARGAEKEMRPNQTPCGIDSTCVLPRDEQTSIRQSSSLGNNLPHSLTLPTGRATIILLISTGREDKGGDVEARQGWQV